MAGTAQVVHAWKEWGIQFLVLLSFTLQVMLLILAEFRRRVDSGVLRFFVWSAYQLADSVAIFALGHMAIAGKSPEHELVALWAPFLLMHLGGQDNITAYAIEDNELWLRHLQTLAVQVAAAAYVLYMSCIFSSQSLLLQLATILMFVVGAVKYGERVWALRCASRSASANNNYHSFVVTSSENEQRVFCTTRTRCSDTEDIIFLGHELLDVPKNLLKGPIIYLPRFFLMPHLNTFRKLHLDDKEAYKVAEVQVSLMHDIFYTKAESQSRVIRLVSALVTAVTLLLLLLVLFASEGGYNQVDVAVTCVLSVGAGVLDAMSLVRCISSSFSWYRCERRGGWDWYARLLMSLRRLIHASDWRIRHSWSRSMGQHNLLQVCTWSKASRSSTMARWLGMEDWWNTRVCSWSVPVSPLIEQMVLNQVLESCGVDKTSPDHILNSQGRAVLKRRSKQLYDRLRWSLDRRLEANILIWHIATDLYLRWYKEQMASRSCRQDDLVKPVEALSNHMLFVLAAHPDMLPPSASRDAYVEMCYSLTKLDYTSADHLAELLRRHGVKTGSESESPMGTIFGNYEPVLRGSQLAAILIGEGSSMLELIAKVWVEMLCYIGNQCSAYSHAKQLSDGGGLITIAAFLIEYLETNLLGGREPVDLPAQRPICGRMGFQYHHQYC